MKATIEVPDDLYRQVKAKSALDGRTIREVTIELYQAWLTEEPTAEEPTAEEAVAGEKLPREKSAREQLQEWFKMMDELMAQAPPGPTAREHLEADRNRSEPK